VQGEVFAHPVKKLGRLQPAALATRHALHDEIFGVGTEWSGDGLRREGSLP
jgi:hypothetical protein